MSLELSFPSANLADAASLAVRLRTELIRRGVPAEEIEIVRSSSEHMDFGSSLVIAKEALELLSAAHGALRFGQFIIDFSKRHREAVRVKSDEAGIDTDTNAASAAEIQSKLNWLAKQEKRTFGVILLGASTFPHKPHLNKSSFLTSKTKVSRVLTKEFLLARKVAKLDLFDTNDLTHEIVDKILKFIKLQKQVTDIIIYYCGHGGFLENRKYYLTLRGTREGREATTGLLFGGFAHDLEGALSGKRTYIILDCCFAGEASSIWMNERVSTFIAEQIQENYAPQGTALFVAASRLEPALAPADRETTLFSGHFIEALREGIRSKEPVLSLVDIANHIRGRIENEPMNRRVKPELHVPRQDSGDVSRLPLFRNRAQVHDEPFIASAASAGPPAISPDTMVVPGGATLSKPHGFASLPTTTPDGGNILTEGPGKPGGNDEDDDGTGSRLSHFLRRVIPAAGIALGFTGLAVLGHLWFGNNRSPIDWILLDAKTAEHRAGAFLAEYMKHAQADAATFVKYARTIYKSEVVHNGTPLTKDKLINLKSDYLLKTSRRFSVIPNAVETKCETADNCVVTGIINYWTENQNLRQIVHGQSRFKFKLSVAGGTPQVSEDSDDQMSRYYASYCTKSTIANADTANVGGPHVTAQIRPEKSLATSLRQIVFSPDKSVFATTAADDRIRLWDATSFKLKRVFDENHPGLARLAFSPDGLKIVSAGSGRMIKVWDVLSGSADYSLEERSNVRSIIFSRNTKPFLLAGLQDGSIPIRDNKMLVRTEEREPRPAIVGLSFTPDKSGTFVAASAGTFTRFSHGESPLSVQAHGDQILWIAYSPDGKKLLTTGADWKIKIWDSEALKKTPIEATVASPRLIAAWSTDGSRIASTGAEREVLLWDAATLRDPRRIGRHNGEVEGLAFHPDGRHLLSTATDNTIRVWDIGVGLPKDSKPVEVLTVMAMNGDSYVAYTAENCYFGSDNVDELFKLSIEGKERRISENEKKHLYMPAGLGLQTGAPH
jgi:WD40 repeat protein